MTNGDESVGEDSVGVAGLEQALEVSHHAPPPLAQVTAKMAEPGTGVVFDAALVIERGAKAVAEIVHAGERLSHGDDGGRRGAGGSSGRRQPRGGPAERGDDAQNGALEETAGGPRASERGADVGGGEPG